MATKDFKKDAITLFDIPFTTPDKRLSPNTWTTRYNLILKGLPFYTEWVELSDVQSFCKQVGIGPTMFRKDGSGIYTLPAIYDPSTNAVVADSFEIAQYLDKTYPEAPLLVPEGTKALHRAFRSVHQSLEISLYPFIFPATFKHIPDASQAYFRTTRERYLGKTLEEATPTGEDGEAAWKKVKAAFSVFDSWFDKEESSGSYIGGDKPCFADLVLMGRAFWIRTAFGEESMYWKDVESWDDGRWGTSLKKFEAKFGSGLNTEKSGN